MSRRRGRQQPKIKAVRRPAKTATSRKRGDQLAQAKVVYADGSEVLFVSRDGGLTFYERAFPDPKAETSPDDLQPGMAESCGPRLGRHQEHRVYGGLTMTTKTNETIHQATVTYSGGKTGQFFSRDGEWFYEHQLPDPEQPEPMSYERGWLERIAAGSASVTSIEFSEI